VSILAPKDWTYSDTEECVGVFIPHLRKICLLYNPDKPALEHTYLHELVHAILHCMGRDELYKDEAFVDLFAGLLHQSLTG